MSPSVTEDAIIRYVLGDLDPTARDDVSAALADPDVRREVREYRRIVAAARSRREAARSCGDTDPGNARTERDASPRSTPRRARRRLAVLTAGLVMFTLGRASLEVAGREDILGARTLSDTLSVAAAEVLHDVPERIDPADTIRTPGVARTPATRGTSGAPGARASWDLGVDTVAVASR